MLPILKSFKFSEIALDETVDPVPGSGLRGRAPGSIHLFGTRIPDPGPKQTPAAGSRLRIRHTVRCPTSLLPNRLQLSINHCRLHLVNRIIPPKYRLILISIDSSTPEYGIGFGLLLLCAWYLTNYPWYTCKHSAVWIRIRTSKPDS
jgi:hypothetical protein